MEEVIFFIFVIQAFTPTGGETETFKPSGLPPARPSSASWLPD